MRFFAKCQVCKQRKFFIDKRIYTMFNKEEVTSQTEQCRRCYKVLKNMLKPEPKFHVKLLNWIKSIYG